ncbi:hypothetical protein TTHERM_00384720 (macronuclear) [Tetrahymena thermophila SB210]|uniref:Uncharacterized protein n=1 Tax=Tetrahymena thermophila (strain SB210) TaxID=312017 RepID=Q23RM0_TETTS|nr:hypothetical protein TTHERM_00384720 [Tetrahymena thermophila SB210]EAR99028.2 hypothetical protein TTHERM_00384720 [Tetrahymena thermophila SB210]|eukprot:XP_001019273.2 hypothetical protein TTHERM_00384720 [Tetrahymena thermophila SB210]
MNQYHKQEQSLKLVKIRKPITNFNEKNNQKNNSFQKIDRDTFYNPKNCQDIDEIDLITREEENIDKLTRQMKSKKLLKLNIKQKNSQTDLMEIEELPLDKQMDEIEEEDEEEDFEDDEDNQQSNNKKKYDVQDLQQADKDQYQICKIINHLLLKNKISQKNAFDIKIPNLLEIQKVDYSQHSSWKFLSSGLGAGARVYGYKVDNTYGDTMKVISKLVRIDAFDEEEINNINNKQQILNKNKKFTFDMDSAIKNSEKAGLKTLELNLDSLNAVLYDLEFDKDPTFWRTSLSFDIKSAETMLLNKLPMDADFGYVVDCEDKIILIVDKQQKEIEKRQENTQNNEYQQLSKIKPWVIRKQGQSVPVIISMYEVLMSQIDEQTIQERQQEICDLNVKIDEGEIGRITLNQEEDRKFISEKPNVVVDYKTLLEQEGGLGDQLQSFEAYIRSKKEPIYSTNKKRWQWENKFFDFVKEQEEINHQLLINQEQQQQQDNLEKIMEEQEQKEVDEQNIQQNLTFETKEEPLLEECQNYVNPNNIFKDKSQESGPKDQNQEPLIQQQENNSFEIRNANQSDEIQIELDSIPQIESRNKLSLSNNKSLQQQNVQSQENIQQSSQKYSKSLSRQGSQVQGSSSFNGPTLFNKEDSNQAFMQLLAFQKNESKKEQLKKQNELQNELKIQLQTNQIQSQLEQQQFQLEEDIYISLGNEEWNRQEQYKEQLQQSSQQQEESKVLSQQDIQQGQSQQNIQQVTHSKQTQKESKSKTKKNKDSYECVIPPPIVFNKEKNSKYNYHYDQQYDQRQEDVQQQNQQKSTDQKNKLKQQIENQQNSIDKNEEYHYRKPFQELNQQKISQEFHEKDSINFNIYEDKIKNDSVDDQEIYKKKQFNVKKIQLENLQTFQEKNDYDQTKHAKNYQKYISNDEFQYHSQVLAEFFGNDLEENDKNQEQIEIYMSDEEDDNDQSKFKHQQQKFKNSKSYKEDANNMECNSDQEVQIIKHKKISQGLQNINTIQLNYLNNILQTQKLRIIENDNDDLVIKIDEDEDNYLNLNDLDSANPFKKGRFEQNFSSDSISQQSFASYDNICEQFLGQDYKNKKKMQQQEEYLKNYQKKFEQRIEKLQNERKMKEASKKDIQKTLNHAINAVEQNLQNKKNNNIQNQNEQEDKSYELQIQQKQILDQENLEKQQKEYQITPQYNQNQSINDQQIIQNKQNQLNLQQMEVEEDDNYVNYNDDNSEVDIFENYLLFFEKKKKGIFNQIKQKEDQIEEEFNKLLYSDQESEENNNEFLLKQVGYQNSQHQQNNAIPDSHKGIDFKMDQVYLVDLNLNVEQNHPLYSVKRYLGDLFYQKEEDLLTERELKDKKYTWGYYSIPKADDTLDNFIDSKKFDMKVFNIGKGTHKIDMRTCQKGQSEYFKIKINDEEQEELQLIQTSKLTAAPKTKEDWEKKKARAIGKRKDLNEIDFNIEEELENYYQVVQPRYRNLQELIHEQKRRRRNSKKYNFDNLTNHKKIEMNLIKKRDILYLLQNDISYKNYYDLHVRCSDYIHYLELPSLKHFVASKNLYEYFKSQDEAVIDINIDEIEIDLNSDQDQQDFDKDDFLKAQFQMDGKEIDFNLFECGLYDALEIDRPCFQDILDNTNIPQISSLQIQQLNEQENKKQNENNYSAIQQKEIQASLEQQIHQTQSEAIVEEEKDQEDEHKQLTHANQRTQQLDNLYSETESNINLSIMKHSKKIKKQNKQLLKTPNDKLNRRKFSIDLEEYSNQMFIDDLYEQRSDSLDIDNFNQKSGKKDKLYNNNLNDQFNQEEISSFPIDLDDYSVMEYNQESNNHNSQQASINGENLNLNMESDQSLQNLESDSSYTQRNLQKICNPIRSLWLSKKLKSYEKEVKLRFKKSEIEQEAIKSNIINEKSISQSKFDIIQENVVQEEGEIDSYNSLEEQYNHKEYKHLRPINLDEYELNRVYNPEVKMEWEVKLEQTYQEIKQKNPYEDFVYLTPNDILLDTLNENNQYLRSIPYLNNLNNLQRFKSDQFQLQNLLIKQSQIQDKKQKQNKQKNKYFQPQICSDFMGMNKKTTMKELIIKIWLFIKQHIKQQDQIQLNEVPFSFYDILLMLPQIIGSQEDAEKISTQNIFSILLHLSNLKNFRLVSNNEGQNFYIFKD